ncbi:SDR family oxidoreductase [Opitutus sp. ER46]|uniref:SDR family NAD(P)-dependent oxidoreductase n=1 Tax=Opitutus sp. ER46 TaxID=2161864 RepID=UPI000D316ED3|nr:SDR family oxidoreductase [Opitutus sp. ER46]PTX91375.1 short-chain dehydrogenase [Opitutus sp. ER46]
MRFKDQHVLVTGAATNTGLGIARRFAQEGATVWLHDLDAAATAAAAQKTAQETAGRVIAAPADLSDAAAIARLFDRIRADAGRLDVLVNNAAQQAIGHAFLDTPLSVFEYTVRVNLIGAFLCAQHAVKLMAPQKRGVIVQMGSNSATRPIRKRCAYVSSKGGVEALARALAVELGPLGIRVNTVVPGYIYTGRWDVLDPKLAARRRANLPIGREATADDIADAVLFLASNQATRITGASLVVDGGCSCQLVPADLET